MSLRDMMTTTASTKRPSPIDANDIMGDSLVDNLTNLLITPVMMPEQQGRYGNHQGRGIDGSEAHDYEAYTESHTHTDGGVSVTQMPDIVEHDRLIIGSRSFTVRMAKVDSLTFGFGQTLILHLTEDSA